MADDIKPGSRVRVTYTYEGVVETFADAGAALVIETDRGHRVIHSDADERVVEVLAPPPPAEPPPGSWVVDRDGDVWWSDGDLWAQPAAGEHELAWAGLVRAHGPVVRLYRADDPGVVLLDDTALPVVIEDGRAWLQVGRAAPESIRFLTEITGSRTLVYATRDDADRLGRALLAAARAEP